VRVALAPFIVVLILAGGRSALDLAAALFVMGAASDGLDGYLARRYGVTTRTGQWLDPLADKILVVAPVLTLVSLGDFPAWAAAIIVGREAAIVVLRSILGLRGRSMPASRVAKVKTFLQIAAITLYILPLGAHWWIGAVLITAVAFTVYTGAHYVVQGAVWLRGPRARDVSGRWERG
jgi:CDP-diacylglycerol--glycerol-3-phosphate 3-phosphatidyltransferase